MGHPAASGSLHSARASETHHQVKMSTTTTTSMNTRLKRLSNCFCLYLSLFFFKGSYGWFQSTAWTVWVVYFLIEAICATHSDRCQSQLQKSICTIEKSINTSHFTSSPLFFCHLAVACTKIPVDSDLCGHVQRVLRGLCHLQLHDLLAQLPGKPVPQPGVDAGVPGAAETPAPPLLLPALANGRVCVFYNWHTSSPCGTPGWPSCIHHSSSI